MAKTETVGVLLRLAPDLLARIDEMRGEVPRSIFIRNRLADMVEAVPVWKSVRTREVKMENGATGVEAVLDGDDASSIGIQIGPRKAGYGDRLKPEKGAKR